MGDVQEYRARGTIRAEKVEEDTRIVTVHGVENVKAGDYLVYQSGGVSVMSGAAFEKEYVVLEESVSEARKFTPAGKTVEVVLEFLKANPDEIERVRELEEDGASRKKILDYAKR